MNTTALKEFARQTRKQLRELIKTKLQIVLHDDSVELREKEREIHALRALIAEHDEDYVIEEVAYTWFNRVMALRFMDANDYTSPRIVTPAIGQQRPEILADALGGVIPEELQEVIDTEKVNEILDNQIEKKNPQEALYRKLLVAECNHWGKFMPFLFENISNYTELLLPDDLLSEQSFVTAIRNGMNDEDCQQVEIVGWLYQYYVSEENERLIQSKNKYKRTELAPASQLFTPEWIVRYMVDNTLGQYWTEMYPESNLTKNLAYYIRPKESKQILFRKKKSLEEVKFYDPCVGSAHILSYAYDVFYMMYEELGYTKSEIPQLIIENNLWGTDIDPRAAQLSAFVLIMKARKNYRRLFQFEIKLNITYYKDFKDDEKFSQAASLGSLITVEEKELEVHNTLTKSNSNIFNLDPDNQHLSKQYQILGQRYDIVVTNPPYIPSKRMDDVTQTFVQKRYPEASKDLFTTFILRCLELCKDEGFTGYMSPFVWMFISSFEDFRKKIIEEHTIHSLIQLEYSGFDGATVPICTFCLRKQKADLKGSYIRLSDFKGAKNQAPRTLEAINDKTCSWFYTTNQENFKKIPGSPIAYWVSEKIIEAFNEFPLHKFATPRAGMITGNNKKFLRLWNEVQINTFCDICNNVQESIESKSKWFPYQKGGPFRKWYGNDEYVVNYENNGCDLKHTIDSKGKVPAHAFNEDYIFKSNVNWSAISSSSFSTRITCRGKLFDASGSAAFPFEINDVWYISAFLNSKIANKMLQMINPTINYQAWEIGNLPIKKESFNDLILNLTKKCYSISSKDWDAHETSWNFKYNELLKIDDASYLKNINYKIEKHYEAIGKHICINPATTNFDSLKWRYEQYCTNWERKFMHLHANEEELNRQFIEIYGLQNELTSTVPLKDITILQKGEIRIEENKIVFQRDVIIKQLLSYLVGCFMGRYSVDKPGLIIADQHVELKSLGLKIGGMDDTPASTLEIDDDGILPLLEEQYFNDDVTIRIQDAIEKLFGKEQYAENIAFIEDSLGKDLRKYIYKDFYKDHVQMYSKRPIYWMFTSAKGTFKALVYMHRIEPDTLSKMHADYVQPFIYMLEKSKEEQDDLQIRDDISTGEQNKARKQSMKIQAQLSELHDFEQQLVEMASHRISLDLDNGVLENYPLFGKLLVKIPGVSKK